MTAIPQQKSCPNNPLAGKTTDELIAYMQEEDDAAERKAILETMTPACRKKFAYCEDWLRRQVDHSLRSRYELGLQVLELEEDEHQNRGKRYGKNAIGRICKILRWDDGVIRLALRFVQTFTTADLERLCAQVLPGGEPLTWSHVRVLVPVQDATRRQELLDRTVAEGWTCQELARQIRTSLGLHAHEEQRGRPARVPRDFDGAVTQQLQSAEQWDRLHQQVWNVPTRSLVTHAAQLPPDQVTNERLHQARELAVQLRRVANQASEQAEKAEQVVRDFAHILDLREQSEITGPGGVTTSTRTR